MLKERRLRRGKKRETGVVFVCLCKNGRHSRVKRIPARLLTRGRRICVCSGGFCCAHIHPSFFLQCGTGIFPFQNYSGAMGGTECSRPTPGAVQSFYCVEPVRRGESVKANAWNSFVQLWAFPGGLDEVGHQEQPGSISAGLLLSRSGSGFLFVSHWHQQQSLKQSGLT